jgi:5'-deoxynucleotidase YfbR-like HD superfamily hydrolase
MIENKEDQTLLDETAYRLLLATIPRWTIIDMRRRQNVAEHSFNTQILALSLYDFMQNGTSHNRFDRESVMMWAIDHDMDEIESGDMPSPLKREMEKLFPKAMDAAVDNMMINKLPSFVSRRRGVKDSYPYDVVKVADKLEEVLYNHKHGYDRRARDALVDGLYLLRDRLQHAEKAHPRYDWGRAKLWLEFFLRDVIGFSFGVVTSGVPSLRDIVWATP